MMICVLQPYLKFLFAEFSLSRFALQFLQLFNGFGKIATDDLAIEWPSSWHLSPLEQRLWKVV